MPAAEVIQLGSPRRATRLGPKEARVLADRARAAGLIPRGTPYRLFAHLLRVVDPRQGFSRSLPQNTPADQEHLPEHRRVIGLADELGVHTDTLWRANRALAASGLVQVDHGSGRSWTRYTVNVAAIVAALGELPGSPWVNHPVHPGESPDPEPPQNAGADPAKCGGTPRETRGQTPQNRASNARARTYARESDSLRLDPPTPATTQPAAGRVGDPPPSGQGPPPLESENAKCPHGRTLAQGGCRTCGTTRRQTHAERARAELQADTQRRIQEQLEQRAQRARVQQAAPDPKPYAAQIRAALRNPTTAQEDQP